MFRKILVPVDGSDKALIAARHARILAEQFESAVTLVHILQHPAYSLADGIMPPLFVKDVEAIGNDILNRALSLYDDFDGRVSTLLECGHPGVRIVELTKERNFSLVVMGRRGLSGVAELLLGSVSNYVIHYSLCPTLIIKDPPCSSFHHTESTIKV